MNVAILDLNQIFFSNLYSVLGKNPEGNLDIAEEELRTAILNTIRTLRVKFKAEYPQFVIACDGQDSWRKKFFPYYKFKRKRAYSTSNLDWKNIYKTLTKVREELTEFFPYQVVFVNEAEADDIIATLAQKIEDQVLIISADKDFIQLQMRPNVKQFDPIRKTWVTNADPKQFLLHHILRGEGNSGDGIPNVLSDDDTFAVEGKRQKSLTGKVIKSIVASLEGHYPDPALLSRFNRNNVLINLACVPEMLKIMIMEVYTAQLNKKKSNILKYFVEKNLPLLTENIGDF